VHDAGTAHKAAGETPTTGGGLGLGSFFDVFVGVSVINNTAKEWLVSDPSQDSGNISKLVPEPSGFLALIGALASLGALVRRRR
jgi:hypothetical protein